MANRTAIRKTKKRAVRLTKSDQFIVNQQYLGDEPFGVIANEMEYARALTWYSYMRTPEDARNYLKVYLIEHGREKEGKAIGTVDTDRICTTAGWIARIFKNCTKISRVAKHTKFFESKIKEMLKFAKTEAPAKKISKVEAKKISVRDRMITKSHDIMGEIEGMVDDHCCSLENFSLYDWMVKTELAGGYCKLIIDKYTPIVDELYAAWEGKDKQLVEGYSYLSKQEKEDMVAFYHQLILDCERYGSNAKKVRKPRKPRTISAAKKLKHFKFMKEDTSLKIASINPEKIIGAQELWTFNTKNKILTVFRALDRAGLQVKRTAIVNFDENGSVSKRSGRKMEETIKSVLDGGKIILRKLMDEIKSKPIKMQNRINANTILLKVVQ